MRAGADTSAIARYAAPLAVAVLAALCAWLAIRLLMTMLGSGNDAATADRASPLAIAAPAARESIARWHLFGGALTPADPRGRVADAPDTALDLTLAGVLAEADPNAGIALIADGQGQQAKYRVGENLPGGARLLGIYRDRVLIALNGREESLRLPREAANVAAAAPGGSSPAASASGGTAPVAVAGLETVDWGAVRAQTGVDPAELARQVRVLPVFEGGQIVGVRLNGGAQAPLIAKLGLKPDDVITAVNGISVRDPARAQQIVAAVRSAERVAVTVRRNGREETLNVSLK